MPAINLPCSNTREIFNFPPARFMLEYISVPFFTSSYKTLDEFLINTPWYSDIVYYLTRWEIANAVSNKDGKMPRTSEDNSPSRKLSILPIFPLPKHFTWNFLYIYRNPINQSGEAWGNFRENPLVKLSHHKVREHITISLITNHTATYQLSLNSSTRKFLIMYFFSFPPLLHQTFPQTTPIYNYLLPYTQQEYIISFLKLTHHEKKLPSRK